jgi:hypothetical protein
MDTLVTMKIRLDVVAIKLNLLFLEHQDSLNKKAAAAESSGGIPLCRPATLLATGSSLKSPRTRLGSDGASALR